MIDFIFILITTLFFLYSKSLLVFVFPLNLFFFFITASEPEHNILCEFGKITTKFPLYIVSLCVFLCLKYGDTVHISSEMYNRF